MTTALLILALVPAAYAALVAGDFSQMIYKPSRRQVYGVVSRRTVFIGLTAFLWLAGLALHLSGSPTAPWLLVSTGLMAAVFLLIGFFMAGYFMFPVVRLPAFIPASEANSRLEPGDMVIGVSVNGEARAYPLKWIARPRDLFAPLVRLMLEKIRQQNEEKPAPFFPTVTRFDPRLPNKAQVLGVETEASTRAYGLDFLQQHPVLNDEVGPTPLLIAYDAEQGAGAIYDRRNNGQVLTFKPAGNGDGSAFIDAETGSTWDQTGRAVDGPLKGTALSPVNHLSRVLWFSWFNFHPQTELSGQTELYG